jgi:hypothetical protein
MATRPKIYTAVKPFVCASQAFAEGDVVDGVALSAALAFGDQFVIVERKSTTTPAAPAITEGA